MEIVSHLQNIIDRSKTRVLSFLNIVGGGICGGTYEQDTHDMDSKLSANVAKQYPQDIVGFKVAHYNGHEWLPGGPGASLRYLSALEMEIKLRGFLTFK